MSEDTLSIGQVAKRIGCKTETIHYYEKIQLIPRPPRTEGGHRVFSSPYIKQLNFVLRARELGFSILQIRELLTFMEEPAHCCAEVKQLATQHQQNIQQKIADLECLQQALQTMINQCGGSKTDIKDCPIIDALNKEHAYKS